MAYVTINGMRSTRYPLQGGLGCSCSPVPATGVGLDVESFAVGGSIAAASLISLAVGAGVMHWWMAQPRRSVYRNRNRRHRRSS